VISFPVTAILFQLELKQLDAAGRSWAHAMACGNCVRQIAT